MKDLFSVSLSKQLELSAKVAGLPLLGIIVVVVISAIFLRWLASRGTGEVVLDSAEFGFGDNKFTLKPNRQDRQIAYAVWVELSTRKIGLEIDPEHDVISEIYSSWYSFFQVTRELIKEIPVGKLKNETTREIVSLSILVLNSGLRPHLTKWQARFRHWFEMRMDEKTDVFPQDIQRKFPDYDELVDDLLRVNNILISYREKMHEIVYGKSSDEIEVAVS